MAHQATTSPASEKRSGVRRGPARWMLLASAMPAFLAAAALFVLCAFFIVRGLHPGVTQDDPRQLVSLSQALDTGLGGALIATLGFYVSRREAARWSLLTIFIVAAGGATLLLRAITRGERASLFLAPGLLLVYLALLAVVRLATGAGAVRPRPARPR
jgi:hypothetical protein